jgi:parvulin-like peptidyl-prolyl isomerase
MRPSPVLLALLALAAPAAAETLDRVAAVVNNEVITEVEVEQRAAPMLESAARRPTAARRGGRRRCGGRWTTSSARS